MNAEIGFLFGFVAGGCFLAYIGPVLSRTFNPPWNWWRWSGGQAHRISRGRKGR